MLLIGICIGFTMGLGYAVIRGDHSNVMLELKRLEREIQADLLECAREERRAAALRVIAANERQAGQV